MDRTYAYLVVVGSAPPAEISSHLGLEPTKAWSKDDPRVPGGTPYGETRWTLRSGVPEDRPWEEHLHALLPVLESRKSSLDDLPSGCEAGIVCVGCFRSATAGFLLSPALMAAYARVGLEIDFDIYLLGSNDDGA
jgi:hypothetical protein